ncbi:MAG: VanZ family protein [Rubrivivax sp.]|nr:VanZ family protein [Rubrivivax sp.]MDP3613910.1 VanZ family protein [Rubrivivax sp.]
MRHLTTQLLAPRHRIRWRLLLASLLLVVSWFAFSPANPAQPFSHADKFEHVLAFGCLALVASLAWAPGWRMVMGVTAGLLLYGGFIETVQSLLPGRVASWADLLADAAGIAAGLIVAQAVRGTRADTRA